MAFENAWIFDPHPGLKGVKVDHRWSKISCYINGYNRVFTITGMTPVYRGGEIITPCALAFSLKT